MRRGDGRKGGDDRDANGGFSHAPSVANRPAPCDFSARRALLQEAPWRQRRYVMIEADAFEDVWRRRQSVALPPGVEIVLPAIDDLILTKLFAARERDKADIAALEALRSRGRK